MSLFPRPLKTIAEKAPATKPAVTAIVTLYNYARHVEECLDSIAAQTQSDLELIVIDDCSKDDGLSVVKAWFERTGDKLLAYRLLAHTANMGASYARNSAIALARADRIFMMDADNALYPRAIERCMQAMTDNASAGAYTQLEIFGDRTGLGEADYWSKEKFKPKNYVDNMALISKAALEKVGGYTQLIVDGWEDYDLWCKFIEHGLECTFVPEVLCRYRSHGVSMSAREAAPNTPTLILQMSIRHPWLDLQ